MPEIDWIDTDPRPSGSVVAPPSEESTRWLVDGLQRDARHFRTRSTALTFGHLIGTAALLLGTSALAAQVGASAVRLVAVVLLALSIQAFVTLRACERSLASIHAAVQHHLPGATEAQGRWHIEGPETPRWQLIVSVGTSMLAAGFLIRLAAGL